MDVSLHPLYCYRANQAMLGSRSKCKVFVMHPGLRGVIAVCFVISKTGIALTAGDVSSLCIYLAPTAHMELL